MIELYYGRGNANLTPHMLLEELGVPYRLRLVDRAGGEQRTKEFLALNPNGLIPVLVDGDLVLWETAAICLHLVDAHPKGGMAPPIGTPERAHFYKWMVWLTNTLQATLVHYFHPDFLADDEASRAALKARAEERVGRALDLLDAELARSGGPWLLGERFSVADSYVLMLGRWTRGFARPARSLPHLGAHLARVLERPATRRAFQQEELAEPWI